MAAREQQRGDGRRSITYCVVPRDLAPKLHEALRRHFRDDPSVEVIVEQRGRDRRATPERRTADRGRERDRRLVRNLEGRRSSSGLP